MVSWPARWAHYLRPSGTAPHSRDSGRHANYNAVDIRVSSVFRSLLLAAAVAGFSGCATNPISKTLRQQARPVRLAEVQAHPAPYIGSVVIWGGRILQTVNATNGASIYVLKLPLYNDARPVRSAVSSGRFIAHGTGFIDPEVFKKGRLVTVAGQITGVEQRPLQSIQYTYPVVAIQELHVWQPMPYYPYWGWYGPGWGSSWGWYGPGWDSYWGWYGPGWGWGAPGPDGDWDLD